MLIEPIRASTGWSEATLSSAYGIGLLVAGIAATVVGRLLDGRGSRVVFLGAAVASAIGHAVVAGATSPSVFLVSAIVTGGVVGASGYSAVHAEAAPKLWTSVRLSFGRPHVPAGRCARRTC